ncbi:uncharacterized protein LOC117592519 [Drosophila guanche]|uniref:SprT-like domain-containing protein n=1 Tax=Drosophila guanche TaxID=7266 RepID=A0A3B0JEN7_DROGU|nr:uncharacterized protein LOC117592519 [Drosophila guanche]SPP73760.1 Hypothetical predicted protein [Drosophila guanche]
MDQISSEILLEKKLVNALRPTSKPRGVTRRGNMKCRLIYIDLDQSVAIVRDKPVADLSLDGDADLKTRLHKFLGLLAPRRRLYNPMESHEPNNSPQKETALPSSRFFIDLDQSVAAARDKHDEDEELKVQLHKILGLRTSPKRDYNFMDNANEAEEADKVSLHTSPIEERKSKLCSDLVFQTNNGSIQEQTTTAFKEPKQWGASICQQHKKSILAFLEHDPLVYGFVESLNPKTAINMCHPRALTYRNTDFAKCRVDLVEVLYEIFNGSIFHCGLQAKIVWKSVMSTPSTSKLGFNVSGHHTAKILLCKKGIRKAGLLIKLLLHEMCHVAAFVFNGETGHGINCRKWGYQSKQLIPKLTLITNCGASYKYSCPLCSRFSFGRMEFKKDSERLRCHYCQFEVRVERWSRTDPYKLPRLNKSETAFTAFVRENYLLVDDKENTHSSKMQLLNRQFMDKRNP